MHVCLHIAPWRLGEEDVPCTGAEQRLYSRFAISACQCVYKKSESIAYQHLTCVSQKVSHVWPAKAE